MSNVTNIILITGIEDGYTGEGSAVPNFDKLNVYLQSKYDIEFNKVDKMAGGNKYMECDVFMIAVNHIDIHIESDVFHREPSSAASLLQYSCCYVVGSNCADYRRLWGCLSCNHTGEGVRCFNSCSWDWDICFACGDTCFWIY